MPKNEEGLPDRPCGYARRWCYRAEGCWFGGQAKDVEEFEQRIDRSDSCPERSIYTGLKWRRAGDLETAGPGHPAPAETMPVR